MPLSSPKQKESEIQNTILEYLAYKRYFFWRQNTAPIFSEGRYYAMPKFSMNGIPDIILIKDGIFWGIEVKRPKGKQSEAQIKFEERSKKAGANYHVVTSLDDVVRLGL